MDRRGGVTRRALPVSRLVGGLPTTNYNHMAAHGLFIASEPHTSTCNCLYFVPGGNYAGEKSEQMIGVTYIRTVNSQVSFFTIHKYHVAPSLQRYMKYLLKKKMAFVRLQRNCGSTH